jgi:hypothetical protein
MEHLRSERMRMIRGHANADTHLPLDQHSGRRVGTKETVHIPARWAVSLIRRS